MFRNLRCRLGGSNFWLQKKSPRSRAANSQDREHYYYPQSVANRTEGRAKRKFDWIDVMS